MKKFLTMLLVVIMLTSITACGDTPASTTPANIENETSPEPTTDETLSNGVDDTIIDDGIVDEGTLGKVSDVDDALLIDTSKVENEGSLFDYTLYWEHQGYNYVSEAWEYTYFYLDNPDIAMHLLYFINNEGVEMTITWDGPETYSNVLTADSFLNLYFGKGDVAVLNMGAWDTTNDHVKDASVEEISTLSTGTPIEGTYQVLEDNENVYRVIYKISDTWAGASTGYLYLIDYLDRNVGYLFEYVVEDSQFNEDEALELINSIRYLDFDALGISRDSMVVTE